MKVKHCIEKLNSVPTLTRFWGVLQNHHWCSHSSVVLRPNQVEGAKPPLQILSFAICPAVLFTWKTRNIKIHWFQQCTMPTMCHTVLWCRHHCSIDGLSLCCKVIIRIETSLRHHSLHITEDMRGWSQTADPFIDPPVVIMYGLLCSRVVLLRAQLAIQSDRQWKPWNL